MSPQQISEMHVFLLNHSGERLTLLREADHLLRRFGQLDLLDLAAGQSTDFDVRAEADRFIFTLSGRVKAVLVDLRPNSPSGGTRVELLLDSENPQGLLAPFGVALSLFAERDSRLILLSTHSEAHSDDHTFPVDELAKYAAIQ